MAMPSNTITAAAAATTPQKRARADSELENTPTFLKKRKIDGLEAGSPSTPKALNAISAAITNIQQPWKQDTKPAPTSTGADKTTLFATKGAEAITAATIPNPTAAAAAPVAESPLKFRPAIKLAALRGTIWDMGDVPKAKLKKVASPRKRRVGRPRKEDFEATGGSVTETQNRNKKSSPQPDPDEYDVDHSDNEKLPDQQTPSARRKKAVKVSSPAPKSILTPSKNRGPRAQKNVTFGSEKTTREVFFEDLRKNTTPAKKTKTTPKKPKENEDEDEIRCEICSRGHSKAPNEIILCDNCDFAAHQVCYDVPEIPEGDWLCKSCDQEEVVKALSRVEDEASKTEPVQPGVIARADIPEIPNLGQHLRAQQRVLLDRCTGRRRISLFGQEEVYDKARQLVEQTILSGEGNSMLLIGARGSGKTTLVENIITDLSKEHRHEFHVVRLNGFIHTDDKLALKEIWRQLGKEMEVEDDLVNRTNYADTMASLLALLSHPSEIMTATDQDVTSQSVVFVIDEFDMFASHPRQTLLYNLFDIAQSRKAPVAVLGCTTRLDVVELLEKRVKSRFSHRYAYLSLPKSLPAYWQICRQGLVVDKADAAKEGIDVSLEGYDQFRGYWTRNIEELYKQRGFQDLLQYHYYTTKSASAFFTEWLLPLSAVSVANLHLQSPSPCSPATSLAPPDSRLQLLQSLSELDLSLLIAAARLDIVAHTDTVNFAMAYDEYSSLVGRQRVQSATSGMLAAGGGIRVWSRGVAGISWERLITLGLLVPSVLGSSRTLGNGGLDGKMWRVDVALEEIPTGVKLNNVMAKWCREI